MKNAEEAAKSLYRRIWGDLIQVYKYTYNHYMMLKVCSFLRKIVELWRELWREAGTAAIIAVVGCSLSRGFYCSASGASVAGLVANAKQPPGSVV